MKTHLKNSRLTVEWLCLLNKETLCYLIGPSTFASARHIWQSSDPQLIWRALPLGKLERRLKPKLNCVPRISTRGLPTRLHHQFMYTLNDMLGFTLEVTNSEYHAKV